MKTYLSRAEEEVYRYFYKTYHIQQIYGTMRYIVINKVSPNIFKININRYLKIIIKIIKIKLLKIIYKI